MFVCAADHVPKSTFAPDAISARERWSLPRRYYWKGEIQDASEILMVSSAQLLRDKGVGAAERCHDM